MQVIELTMPLAGVSETTGEQVICFGVGVKADGELTWLVIEGTDGRPALEHYADVRIDWRHDEKAGWISVGAAAIKDPADK